jgi:hypothetical protein
MKQTIRPQPRYPCCCYWLAVSLITLWPQLERSAWMFTWRVLLEFPGRPLAYMNSSDFKPSTSLSVESFKNLFETGVRKEGIKVLDNISYE